MPDVSGRYGSVLFDLQGLKTMVDHHTQVKHGLMDHKCIVYTFNNRENTSISEFFLLTINNIRPSILILQGFVLEVFFSCSIY